jgi:hypothetical protein
MVQVSPDLLLSGTLPRWTDCRVFVKKMENFCRGVHTGTNVGNVSIEFITLHAKIIEV